MAMLLPRLRNLAVGSRPSGYALPTGYPRLMNRNRTAGKSPSVRHVVVDTQMISGLTAEHEDSGKTETCIERGKVAVEVGSWIAQEEALTSRSRACASNKGTESGAAFRTVCIWLCIWVALTYFIVLMSSIQVETNRG